MTEVMNCETVRINNNSVMTMIGDYVLVIMGFGLIPERSCDQNEGTEPRTWI